MTTNIPGNGPVFTPPPTTPGVTTPVAPVQSPSAPDLVSPLGAMRPVMGSTMGDPRTGLGGPLLAPNSQEWHAVKCAGTYRSKVPGDPLTSAKPVSLMLTDAQRKDINEGKGLSAHKLTRNQIRMIQAEHAKLDSPQKGNQPLAPSLFNAFFFPEELAMLADKGNLGELMCAMKLEDALRYQALVAFLFQMLQAEHEKAMVMINNLK